MSRAGQLIREARASSGLTQTALAALSGVPQNIISDYERGRREPSFGVVDLILHAAGVELSTTPTSTLDRLHRRREDILRVLAAGGMTRVSVFGSVARGEDASDSDVDLLVDVSDGTGLFELLRAQAAVEDLIRRRVDLVPRTGLKPDVAADAERDAVPL